MLINRVLEKLDSISEIVGLHIVADLFTTVTRESNLYLKQNSVKWNMSVKALRGEV
jgi:hypothetical protein